MQTVPELIIYSDTKQLYLSVRQRTEALCEPLEKEDYIPQPAAFVSPPKWHLAHTTWFFEEFILKTNVEHYQPFHPDFSYLFNSYYVAAGKRMQRADRGSITRPGVTEVYRYRKYVDAAMVSLIESAPDSKDLQSLIKLGLNHEQQHQELLITDLKYIFSCNPIFPVYGSGFSLAEHQSGEEGWIKMREGVYEIGHEGDGFHYDNERGRHKVFLSEYAIRANLVTNHEYIEFINDGGYQRPELWLDEGWSWKESQDANSPLYWHQVEGEWHQYKLTGMQPVAPGDIITHVNFFESWAFATWKQMRLPTEFEWEAAAEHFSWGLRWEWTNSAYLPYPGYQTAPGALGEYNGKFMINQMVLRGASVATSPGHSRKTYRNFFHPHLGWQCTGIRLAERQDLN